MAGDDEQPPLSPPKREMNSPFFLGTGDRPGDFITPTRLRGDNYDDWASDIQLALEARRKFEFLEGTITGPQLPYTQSDWNTVNAMLVSWITNTIDPEVKSTLSKFRDAKRLWEHLKQRYAMVNGPRIQQLKTSIAKCEQPKSMSVTTYYGKLNVLWEELFKHEPLISCTCCSSCTAASLHQARREQGKLHDFLMGLNTDLYAQLRTNILSQDPLPSLDRAYQLVIQDERVRLAKAVTEDKPAEVLGFAVRTGAGRGRGKTERPVCSHCKKTGHETSTCWSLVACPHCHKHGHDKNNCYEIVGYPEGWLDQNKADGGAGRNRQQAGRGRGSARANAASSTVGASSTKSSIDQLFTPEQWKALASLIGNAQVPDDRLNGKFDTKSWIIDTGATHHVTGDLSWLFDTIALFECPVGLPNGESVVATQSVDDLIISGNDSTALKTFKAYLSDCFKMKDLGVLKYFLGIEVARSSAGLFLCQRKYTLDIVSEAGLLGAKPCGFPIEQNHRLGLANGELLSNPESYRRLVGRLIYLAVTRPDLAYSVHILSQFMQEPRIEHWEAALRVVRYLKGTPGQGILLRADSDLSLQGWCDSDWAACPVTRCSLSGWLVFLGQSPISWKTKKQHTVSCSSAEAEYRAMAAVTCELKWLKGLLLSLGVHHPKAIKLFCDSQSALHMAKNPVFHERTKHIEVDCHFVRDAITDGLIAPSYVPTITQLADIFTKALGKKQFDYLLAKLGIFEPHAPT